MGTPHHQPHARSPLLVLSPKGLVHEDLQQLDRRHRMNCQVSLVVVIEVQKLCVVRMTQEATSLTVIPSRIYGMTVG